MQIHNLLFIAALTSSGFVFANEETSKTNQNIAQNIQSQELKSVDTFEQLINLQGQATASKLNAEIRVNQNSGNPAGKSSPADAAPINANPLMNASQTLLNSEPTLEAIWGLAGKEVAEINYKGQRMAVSVLSPHVSKEDGWLLEKIEPYQVILVQKKGQRVVKRKEIPLNWQGNIDGIYASDKSEVGSGVKNSVQQNSYNSMPLPFVPRPNF